MDFDTSASKIASENDFELAGYVFEAEPECTRSPRIVRVGLVQNRIVKCTDEDVNVQRDALHQRMTSIIEAASLARVNVLCFQEAWSNLT